MSRHREEVPEVWVSRIADYKARKEPMPDWCERNEISQSQLYYWMDKLKRQQALAARKPQFLPICLDEPVADGPHQAQPDPGSGASPLLIRIGPATVEVGPSFDASVLAEVIKVLKSLC